MKKYDFDYLATFSQYLNLNFIFIVQNTECNEKNYMKDMYFTLKFTITQIQLCAAALLQLKPGVFQYFDI